MSLGQPRHLGCRRVAGRVVRGAKAWLAAWALLLWACTAAAHVMPAQRGTLNLVGDGAFMVLSLPVSAFAFADEDGDQRLSLPELGAHHARMAQTVQAQVQLFDAQGARPLQGVFISLSPADNDPPDRASQVLVLGRFALAQANATQALRWRMALFGVAAAERSLQATASRPAAPTPQSPNPGTLAAANPGTDTHAVEKQALLFTPDASSHALFPSAWAVFADHVALGVSHILTGADHLLFLLVVLSAGGGWRHMVWVLSCFTLGHAATLSLSLLGGHSVSAAVVEPAIAASIVGMAAYDLWARRRPHPPLGGHARLLLVFAFALVHGLGLAGALGALGLDSRHLVLSLVGFNTGIELAQLAVSAGAGVCAWALARRWGTPALVRVQRLGSVAAAAMGLVWLVQRLG